MNDVRRFLIKGALFSLPLFVWVALVVLIDPFNYFAISKVIPEKTKIENAASLNTLLYNMIKADREPHENLVIGDSRAENLPISEIQGEKYHLLAANALKLNESLDLFYFATRKHTVKNVIFTINFNLFNHFSYADRVHSVEDMIKNPLLYIFDRNVAQAAFTVAKAYLKHTPGIMSTPPMTQDQFWDFIVNVRATEHYGRYKYPDALLSKLVKALAYAKERHIGITIIIIPHNQDFQKRVREFGLLDDYLRFKRDLSKLDARVIDFDYVNPITIERSNFTDPIHPNKVIGKQILDEVLKGPLVVGKLLDKDWAEQCEHYTF